MKNIFLVIVILSSLIITSCSNDEIDAVTATGINDETATQISLTTNELDDLLFLREEEKLARDVYLFSFEKYNMQIFKNISNSEVQHMSNVLQLLNTYNIDDPASTEIGVFNNSALQAIYNELIEQSSISLIEALKVGDKIEDLDIRDLALNELRTDKSDLLSLYGSLKCGSINHLRSFHSQVLQNNGEYMPEFISQEYFDSIVTTSNEKCGSN
ncbi:DUF2202 domain-containing protein [Lutibacter maritimus]|uniref:DUF2202 domain-containing protein n=1 Tax=Lutibacter maritimus TaxID=593133 RepID=A0A1I6P2I8_9FLAO|nr:DUF2202 domain-containing protein [Lutibacter maritimus]SFS34298.1 hypothetical protein SAMN04488006_0823 [Lutibacter maritimus]